MVKVAYSADDLVIWFSEPCKKIKVMSQTRNCIQKLMLQNISHMRNISEKKEKV